MKRFAGRVAVVTGGASGIGRATAERLAAEGASVVVADRNLEGARAVAAAISQAHGAPPGATAIGFDAAQASDCYRLIDETVAALGRLDVLCNIAGMLHWNRIAEFEDDWWDRVLKVNLYAVFHLSKRAVPHLLATRGNIVNMSSAAGLAGVPYSPAYTASKHGVVGLTRSMAVELADRGVRVNAICPGAVVTPLVAPATIPSWIEPVRLMAMAPRTGRPSQPAEIAAAVAYLASDDACNVTGTALVIDGGQTAG